MIPTVALAAATTFCLGARHGADPDHLAAIDNLTRSVTTPSARMRRSVGALFAIGHSAMIGLTCLVIARNARALAPYAGPLETVGGIVSVTVLVAMAVANVRGLLRGADGRAGLKSRLVPRLTHGVRSPFVALPIGFVFGLGFETSSQLAAYGSVVTNAAASGGIVVAAAFCVGLVAADTLDGVFVERAVADPSGRGLRARRTWSWVVSGIAVVVAAYECVGLAGVATSAAVDLDLGLGVCTLVAATFLYVRLRGFREARSG